MDNPIFCLMGPTASGKTAAAIALVQQFPMEIVSVDSAMIYRDMNIGTAKPSAEELRKAPHHLIDIIDPTESYSAAQFCTDTGRICKEIHQRGKFPLLVGGTMMYFNALQHGLSDLPESNEESKKWFAEQLMQHGLAYMYQQLQLIDPQSAARIHANDSQRITRALEVYRLSGKTLSSFWSLQKETQTDHFINLILWPKDRAWLHHRIALRFVEMLELGFVDEVRHLLVKWHLTPNHPAMRCVGYRQILEYLQGNFEEKNLAEKGIAATRQLAKRQLTWLRSWSNASSFYCDEPAYESQIVALLHKIIDNNPHF